jgi:NitT/TauT family transport system substrate-binding protein
MIDRRELLTALALAAPTLLARRPALASEPPPETARLRLVWTGSTCQAPQYVADELLKLEGFKRELKA